MMARKIKILKIQFMVKRERTTCIKINMQLEIKYCHIICSREVGTTVAGIRCHLNSTVLDFFSARIYNGKLERQGY